MSTAEHATVRPNTPRPPTPTAADGSSLPARKRPREDATEGLEGTLPADAAVLAEASAARDALGSPVAGDMPAPTAVRITNRETPGKLLVVDGPRRSGKTTFAEGLRETLYAIFGKPVSQNLYPYNRAPTPECVRDYRMACDLTIVDDLFMYLRAGNTAVPDILVLMQKDAPLRVITYRGEIEAHMAERRAMTENGKVERDNADDDEARAPAAPDAIESAASAAVDPADDGTPVSVAPDVL